MFPFDDVIMEHSERFIMEASIYRWRHFLSIARDTVCQPHSLGAMEHDPKFSVKVFFFADYSSLGCP